MKNLKVYLFIGFIFIIILAISQCGSKRQTFTISINQNDSADRVDLNKQHSLKNINLYLDASIGMKGYINRATYADSSFLLKALLPGLIIDLQNENYKLNTYVINDKIEIISPNRFIGKLKDRTLFYGGNDLKDYLPKIISDTSESVNIVISDFIYDNVEVDNLSILSDVRTAIYESLCKTDKTVLLLQYFSDFDADYYYNMRTWQRPFLGESLILKKRPFYLLVIGNYQQIKKLIDSKYFKKYENAIIYADDLNIINRWSLIKSYSKGSVAIRELDNEIIIYKPKKSKLFSFAIGHDFLDLPIGINADYLNSSTSLKQDYLKDNIQWEWLKKENFKTEYMYKMKPKDRLILSKELNISSHVLIFNILNFNNIPDENFSLFVHAKQSNWVSESNFDSDLDIGIHNYQLLERKTPLFSVLSDALKDRFYSNDKVLIEIIFSKKNKK